MTDACQRPQRDWDCPLPGCANGLCSRSHGFVRHRRLHTINSEMVGPCFALSARAPTGNTPQKETARSLGYKDVALFARVFRKVTGLAPGTHRKNSALTPCRLTISRGRTPDFSQSMHAFNQIQRTCATGES